MEDSDIIQLYWDRSERAIAETSGKYGSFLRRIAWNILHSTATRRNVSTTRIFAPGTPSPLPGRRHSGPGWGASPEISVWTAGIRNAPRSEAAMKPRCCWES